MCTKRIKEKDRSRKRRGGGVEESENELMSTNEGRTFVYLSPSILSQGYHFRFDMTRKLTGAVGMEVTTLEGG